MSNQPVLQEALRLFQFYPDKAVHNLQPELDLINGTLLALTDEMDHLLGIEQARRDQILEQMAPLADRKEKVRKMIAFSTAGFHSWIPLSPLSWRNTFKIKTRLYNGPFTSSTLLKVAGTYVYIEVDLPVFALFDINSPKFVIKEGQNQPITTEPELPGAINDCYQFVAAQISKIRRNWNTIQETSEAYIELQYDRNPETGETARNNLNEFLTELHEERIYLKAPELYFFCGFNGTIPTVTKSKIRDALPLFDRIFLLTEVNMWQVDTKSAPSLKVDPVVVGWHNLFPKYLWYIDAFDITPLENKIPIVP